MQLQLQYLCSSTSWSKETVEGGAVFYVNAPLAGGDKEGRLRMLFHELLVYWLFKTVQFQ